jgi:predicted outer membrane protein
MLVAPFIAPFLAHGEMRKPAETLSSFPLFLQVLINATGNDFHRQSSWECGLSRQNQRSATSPHQCSPLYDANGNAGNSHGFLYVLRAQLKKGKRSRSLTDLMRRVILMRASATFSKLFTVSLGLAMGAALLPRTLAAADSDASMTDKHFVSEALKGGMAEVEMGKLAQEKSNSQDVKDFGQKMIKDHTDMGDQMKQVATQVGVTPPGSPTMLQQVEIKKLKGLSGDQFDQEYIKAMVKDHESDLQDFNKEAQNGKSATVKDAAKQGADVVSAHLEMIRKIAHAHNVATQ